MMVSKLIFVLLPLKEKLDSLKLCKTETYGGVIERLIECYEKQENKYSVPMKEIIPKEEQIPIPVENKVDKDVSEVQEQE